MIYSYLKGTFFATSLIRGAVRKRNHSITLRTTSPSRAFGAPVLPTRGILINVNHNVHNKLRKRKKWRCRFKIKFLRLTSAFLSSPNCFTFADTFSVYTAGVYITKTMSSAVSQRFWNKNVLSLHDIHFRDLRNGPDENDSNNGNELVGMQKRC